MKKWLSLMLVLMMSFVSVAGYAANEWDYTQPDGTDNVSDLDDIIPDNIGEPLDRLLANYRNGAYGYANTNSSFYVSAGEVVCQNAAGTLKRFRANTSATSVGWTEIDTGAEASSTTYYYYADCDADANTFAIVISTSSSAPSGVTYYKKLGAFYNNSSSNIEIGGIVEMFSGHIDSIPPGYVLCNGSNGTPDLRDLFIIGAGTSASVGDSNSSPSSNNLTGSGTSLHYDSPNGTDRGDSGAATPRVLYEDNGTPGNGTNLIMPYYALAFIMRQGVE